MVFRIHGEHKDGTKDYLDIEGDSLGEIREQAIEESKKRNWGNLWSEELTEFYPTQTA